MIDMRRRKPWAHQRRYKIPVLPTPHIVVDLNEFILKCRKEYKGQDDWCQLCYYQKGCLRKNAKMIE